MHHKKAISSPFVISFEGTWWWLTLTLLQVQEEFIKLEATDSKGQKAVTDSTYLQSHKLRQMRACNIQAGNNLQVSTV